MKHVILAFLCLSATAIAQEPLDRFTKGLLQRAEEEYRLYFQRPVTVIDFWAAVKYEMEVGKFDLAALHLKLMLQKIQADPAAGDKELAKIEEVDGISAFLRLKNVRKWSEYEPLQKEAEESVKTLIDQVGVAMETHLSDPDRMKKFIKNLDAPTPEERTYAFVQLNRSRERAVPYLVEVLRVQVDKPLRRRVFEAMLKMEPEILPPLYEILKARNAEDAAAPDLRMTILDLLNRRGDKRITPYLWHMSESLDYPYEVRARAKSMLVRMLELDPKNIPPAKIVLTQMAEKFYAHKARFPDPKIVRIWPWDGTSLPLKPLILTHNQAEEIFGMRYAKEALSLDANYKPAQLIFLNFGLDRSLMVKEGDNYRLLRLDELSLGTLPAHFQELLTTIDADLLVTAMERGLSEQNYRIVLPILRVLGERGEVRAARANNGAPRGIVKALYHSDRRVQYAAVQAMLRMPGQQVPVAAERIVDVLRRFVAARPAPKLLVLFTPVAEVADLRQDIIKLGFDPVMAKDIREAMEQLARSADFDAILVHHAASEKELPYALTQLRGDVDSSLLPLLLFSTEEQEAVRVRQAQRFSNTWVLPAVVLKLPEELIKNIVTYVTQAGGEPLSPPERDAFTKSSMDTLWRMSRGEISGYNLQPALSTIIAALQRDDLAVQAVEILGRTAGTPIQERLADIVLDPALAKLRMTAAVELNRHVQKHGVTLDRRRLLDLKAAWQNPAEDAGLRGQLALVMGSMRPTVQQTGARLTQFDPFADQK